MPPPPPPAPLSLSLSIIYILFFYPNGQVSVQLQRQDLQIQRLLEENQRMRLVLDTMVRLGEEARGLQRELEEANSKKRKR